MLEKDFNALVVASLKESGYGYKIPDMFSSSTQQRSKAPFDGFGYFMDEHGVGHPVYFESKYLQKPKSFPISRFEPHQQESLQQAYKILGDNAISILLIFVCFTPRDKRVFFWMNEDLDEFIPRREQKANIYKKEFEKRTNFVRLYRQRIDFNEILNLRNSKNFKSQENTTL